MTFSLICNSLAFLSTFHFCLPEKKISQKSGDSREKPLTHTQTAAHSDLAAFSQLAPGSTPADCRYPPAAGEGFRSADRVVPRILVNRKAAPPSYLRQCGCLVQSGHLVPNCHPSQVGLTRTRHFASHAFARFAFIAYFKALRYLNAEAKPREKFIKGI